MFISISILGWGFVLSGRQGHCKGLIRSYTEDTGNHPDLRVQTKRQWSKCSGNLHHSSHIMCQRDRIYREARWCSCITPWILPGPLPCSVQQRWRSSTCKNFFRRAIGQGLGMVKTRQAHYNDSLIMSHILWIRSFKQKESIKNSGLEFPFLSFKIPYIKDKKKVLLNQKKFIIASIESLVVQTSIFDQDVNGVDFKNAIQWAWRNEFDINYI